MSDLLAKYEDIKRRREAAFKAQAQAQAQYEHKKQLLEAAKAEAFEQYQCNSLGDLKAKLASEEEAFAAHIEEQERLLSQLEKALNL